MDDVGTPNWWFWLIFRLAVFVPVAVWVVRWGWRHRRTRPAVAPRTDEHDTQP